MKQLISLFLFLSMATIALAAKPKNTYVQIRTDFGVCIIRLYNETPLHRDNFIKLVKEDIYQDVLFHRVIEHFMIQGGDPESRTAKPGQLLGEGDLGYTISAEFRDSLFHKKGVLAAARDNNPEKASSSCQFYIVQGKTFTDAELDRLEEVRLEGRQIPSYQREVYKTIGGTPHLDRNYTVFGEVVQGLDVIDKIAAVPTDDNDRPVIDQKMQITLLKRGEAKRLERALGIQPAGFFNSIF